MKKLMVRNPLRVSRLALRTARWYISYWRRRPRPLGCGCYITTRCNLACDFCDLSRFPGAPELKREEALRLARTLGKMGCVYFSISGGEPLLVPWSEEVLEAAKKAGVLYTHLVTNGLLLDEERARSLREVRLDEISISIDGDAAFHDRIRGRDGSHAAACAAVEAVRDVAPKTTVVVNTVVMPAQPEQALHVLGLVKKLGVLMKIQPRNYHPDFGCGVSRNNSCPPDEAGIKRVLGELARSDRVINSRTFLRSAAEFLITGSCYLLDKKPCILGYHHLEIWPDGTVYPCLEGMGWKSDFKLQSWPGVMNSPDYINRLEDLKNCPRCRSTCYVCYYESRLSFPLGNFIRYR